MNWIPERVVIEKCIQIYIWWKWSTSTWKIHVDNRLLTLILCLPGPALECVSLFMVMTLKYAIAWVSFKYSNCIRSFVLYTFPSTSTLLSTQPHEKKIQIIPRMRLKIQHIPGLSLIGLRSKSQTMTWCLTAIQAKYSWSRSGNTSIQLICLNWGTKKLSGML